MPRLALYRLSLRKVGLRRPDGAFATRALGSARGQDADFYNGKLAACRYFFRWELPRIGPQLELLDSLDSTCLDVQPAWL